MTFDGTRVQFPGQNPRAMLLDRHVVHACPQCEIGNPRPLCDLCLGAGAVTEPRLAQWQASILRGTV